MRAFVISLNPSASVSLSLAIERHLGMRPTVFQAIDGLGDMSLAQLPLYTQYTIQHGRHHHVQIGNAAMVGCLLSHMAIWALVKPVPFQR